MSTIQLTKNSEKTVIQVASSLVDSVTNLLFSQITKGSLLVDENQKALQIDRSNKNANQQSTTLLKKSKIKIQMETIDIDEHKKRMRKFISQNKKFKRNRQMRSVEYSQKSMKILQEQSTQKQSEKNKILEDRRRSIQKRLEAKRNLLKEIQKSCLESNSTIQKIQRKKFLYQQKQQQYYNKVILPKIQKEKEILQKKKKVMRTPMDMNQILEHQKSYEALKVNSKVNRSLTISVIKNQNSEYHAPQFVPQSFKKLQEEEQNQKLEDQIKKKQVEVNEIRKKQFLKKVDELRELQKQLSKSKQKVQSPKKQQKIKVKQQLNREEAKNVGNQYLRELLSSNRKFAKKLKPLANLNDVESPTTPRQHKSEYEIEIIKEERIERIHRIRSKKINQLMHDKSLDERTRQEKLQYEIEKLDDEAGKKYVRSNNNIQAINESALIMMNAIEAKMALLGVQPSKPA